MDNCPVIPSLFLPGSKFCHVIHRTDLDLVSGVNPGPPRPTSRIRTSVSESERIYPISSSAHRLQLNKYEIYPIYSNIIRYRTSSSTMATNSNAPDNPEQALAAPNSQPTQNTTVATVAPTIPESRMPTKKDTSLREFLSKMDDYAPIVRSHTTPISNPATPAHLKLTQVTWN